MSTPAKTPPLAVPSVERWSWELTRKRIRRRSFGSVEDLEKAIEEFLAAWNEKPKTFRVYRHRRSDR
jgi:hypothetical protein